MGREQRWDTVPGVTYKTWTGNRGKQKGDTVLWPFIECLNDHDIIYMSGRDISIWYYIHIGSVMYYALLDNTCEHI